MFRKFIDKIFNFIQWIKKWHFVHLLFVPTMLITFYVSDLVIAFSVITKFVEKNYETILYGVSDTHFHHYVYILFRMLIPAIIGEIFFVVFNSIRSKKLYVTNNFLLHNEIYNIAFVLSLIYFIALIIFII